MRTKSEKFNDYNPVYVEDKILDIENEVRTYDAQLRIGLQQVFNTLLEHPTCTEQRVELRKQLTRLLSILSKQDDCQSDIRELEALSYAYRAAFRRRPPF